MNIGEITEFLSRYTYFEESRELLKFFEDLPPELDLASAQYYIKSEFIDQSRGYDEDSMTYDHDDEEEEVWCELCQEWESPEF